MPPLPRNRCWTFVMRNNGHMQWWYPERLVQCSYQILSTHRHIGQGSSQCFIQIPWGKNCKKLWEPQAEILGRWSQLSHGMHHVPTRATGPFTAAVLMSEGAPEWLNIVVWVTVCTFLAKQSTVSNLLKKQSPLLI